jgi:hypothetical protein
MAVRISTIIKKKEDLDLDIKINFKFINRIFRECFLFITKNDQSFYEILYSRNRRLKVLILKKIIDLFYKFFEHKVYNRKYKLRFKTDKRKKVKKQKTGKFLFKFKKKSFRRRRFKRKLLNMLERQKIAHETKVSRYLKNSYADRLPNTRNILHLEKIELPNIMNFENFGINPYRGKRRKFIEEGRFYNYFRNICYKFLNKIKPILVNNFNTKKMYLNVDKFHKDIFYYCLVKDFHIKKKKKHFSLMDLI